MDRQANGDGRNLIPLISVSFYFYVPCIVFGISIAYKCFFVKTIPYIAIILLVATQYTV